MSDQPDNAEGQMEEGSPDQQDYGCNSPFPFLKLPL